MGRWRKYIRISLAFHLVMLALVGLAVQQKLPLAPSNRSVQIDIVPLGDRQESGGAAGTVTGKSPGESAAMTGAANVVLPALADAIPEAVQENFSVSAAPQEGVKEQPAFPGNETGERNSQGTTTGKRGQAAPLGSRKTLKEGGL